MASSLYRGLLSLIKFTKLHASGRQKNNNNNENIAVLGFKCCREQATLSRHTEAPLDSNSALIGFSPCHINYLLCLFTQSPKILIFAEEWGRGEGGIFLIGKGASHARSSRPY